ncbi:protein of unknown function [Mariniphaga anaerophila]|uniref:DUF4412 domain-containing protein n=1 Tax=Mariniphaga anaerophila TaxID=1484053 RepID=A0A1M4TRZ0_9BACT|nr:DUF4412 domain-containing protein [Mariniphaga anaerophila]SHE47213.1 protein of unknown function [Mariniphaga anaerophila]
MKLLIRISLITILSALFVQPVQSQRLLRKLQEKVQEKVEEKVEKKADEKIDEAIDSQLDKIEQSLESNSENDSDATQSSSGGTDRDREQQVQSILKGLGMGGEPVPVATNYVFDHLVEMQIESYKKNGKKDSEGKFLTLINPNSQSMAYRFVSGDMGNPGQGTFIIDAENGATIILNEEKGEKTGIVYGMGAFFSSIGESYEEETMDETPEAYLANPNVKKTGRSKTIAGYKCDEYKYSDEESDSEIWITKDMKLSTQDFFTTLFKTNLYSRGIPWGYMMEATTVDKKNGEKTFMQVTRVETNANKNFKMSDYNLTNLGSFTMPAQEEQPE